jgi:hypothetical protein
MAGKQGSIWTATGIGSLSAGAAAFFLFLSASACPAVAEDAAVTVAGERDSTVGSRVRLRAGVSPEESGEAAAADATARQRSDEGLEERAGMTAAGGTTVHLRGRYRSSTALRRDDEGATSIECTADLPAPSQSD